MKRPSRRLMLTQGQAAKKIDDKLDIIVIEVTNACMGACLNPSILSMINQYISYLNLSHILTRNKSDT